MIIGRRTLILWFAPLLPEMLIRVENGTRLIEAR